MTDATHVEVSTRADKQRLIRVAYFNKWDAKVKETVSEMAEGATAEWDAKRRFWAVSEVAQEALSELQRRLALLTTQYKKKYVILFCVGRLEDEGINTIAINTVKNPRPKFEGEFKPLEKIVHIERPGRKPEGAGK